MTAVTAAAMATAMAAVTVAAAKVVAMMAVAAAAVMVYSGWGRSCYLWVVVAATCVLRRSWRAAAQLAALAAAVSAAWQAAFAGWIPAALNP
jgi:hypothetical protein